ncbi:hypothetical protein IQ265_13705 [Nodosilinea sp. LEGE 06152]|uniref:hypothetical protein n=1 Tax=Nodosilinea sp. LEGE 06152 TaxID=2777966 RepID=UPI00188155DF|nr:hypothetical protein [Nodosilinea sp. LEGE 06152]MBE9157871.1 hypothetical protein [Nodosilinea sp. LEGE 06152]
MPPLASAPAATSQVVRPELNFVVLFKEQKFSEAIARTRIATVANTLVYALQHLDPDGEYTTIISQGKQFDYCLVDLRMQPNMIIAETIGRTEAAILHQRLVTIDPANMRRYAIARCGQLDIQGS